LDRFSINANGSIISSHVEISQITQLGTSVHPLQGQANYLFNGLLTYGSRRGNTEMSVLLSMTGKRLRALGYNPEPDIYEQPSASLDLVMSVTPLRTAHIKIAAKNLLDPRIRELAGDGREVSGYRNGRSYSIAYSTGS
jgi:hypothetical protein